MDIFILVVICILCFIVLSVCGWCCKRKREGTIYGFGGTNVHISSQPISASPVVVPPYPIEARHPTPHGGGPPPPVGFTHSSNPPYPTHTPHPVPASGGGVTPYPPMGGGMTPYPPMGGGPPYPPAQRSSAVPPHPPIGGGAPYPPPHGSAGAPPSYSEAVLHGSTQPPPFTAVHEKQAPFNPHY